MECKKSIKRGKKNKRVDLPLSQNFREMLPVEAKIMLQKTFSRLRCCLKFEHLKVCMCAVKRRAIQRFCWCKVKRVQTSKWEENVFKTKGEREKKV